MKSRSLKLTALATLILCAGSICAQAFTYRTSHAAAFQQTESVTLKGQLTSADEKGLAITDAAKVEHKFGITETTKVTKGGKDATLADLNMNDNITVVASKATDGTLTASSIDITSAE